MDPSAGHEVGAGHDPTVEQRVLVLAPTRRDAQVTQALLARAGLNPHVCDGMKSLAAEAAAGAAALLLTEEAAESSDLDDLLAVLGRQAEWSELPVLVVARGGDASSPALARVAASVPSVTLLERPVLMRTLVSAVQAALRARKRQYQVRAQMEQILRAGEALARSEQWLRLALQAGRLGAWRMDLATGAIEASDTCLANFGLPPDARLDRDALYSLIHPDDRERVRAAVDEALRGGGDYRAEYRVRWPDGSTHWVAASGRLEPGRVGVVSAGRHMVGVTQDVTARKHAEAEREQLLQSERAARSEAERHGRLKDEFLATLSHELRTPLNAILGWASLLSRRDHLDEDLAEGLAVIERNARAQTQIIEDLLDMSRIISGKIPLDVRPVDLAAVVRAAVDTVRPAADAKGIDLRLVTEVVAAPRGARSGGPFKGDPGRLQQVVWNLVNNAIKFTPQGGRVSVTVDEADGHARIAVADTGQGIRADFLPHLFERFRQADASTTRRHGGLGLGLSIVKNLVELHGGRVSAASDGEARGATLTVFLPLHPAVRDADSDDDGDGDGDGTRTVAASAAAVDPARPVPSNGEPQSIAGLRVLAVDDEPDARAVVARILEDGGARVITAGSAAEALAALDAAGPFDLILSDIGMPDRDGYDLIREVRARRPDAGGAVPAAALSALARPEDRARALASGYQAHVAKPVRPADLVAAVAALVAATAGGARRLEA